MEFGVRLTGGSVIVDAVSGMILACRWIIWKSAGILPQIQRDSGRGGLAARLRVPCEQTQRPRQLEILPDNIDTGSEPFFLSHTTHVQSSAYSQAHLLSPMHACLNVDEIVRLILRELVE